MSKDEKDPVLFLFSRTCKEACLVIYPKEGLCEQKQSIIFPLSKIATPAEYIQSLT